MNNNVDVLKSKVKYFFDSQIPVHVTYQRGYWKNGKIKEIGTDFFLIDEFLEGERVVFLLEIEDIVEYKSPEEVRNA